MPATLTLAILVHGTDTGRHTHGRPTSLPLPVHATPVNGSARHAPSSEQEMAVAVIRQTMQDLASQECRCHLLPVTQQQWPRARCSLVADVVADGLERWYEVLGLSEAGEAKVRVAVERLAERPLALRLRS